MKNIKLKIEYDGTNYHGWQSQDNAEAICDVLSNAVNEVTGENVKLYGASRTDAGVHAYGQVANFFTDSNIPPDKYTFVLNTVLPPDIVIKESREASEKFHSQYYAKGKKYQYLIYNEKTPSALMRNKAYFVPQGLKITKMKEAAKYFIGEYDFSAFCAAGSSVKSFTRTIYGISVEKSGEIIKIEVEGNGFLYNMVRIIAGTLADVGKGKISADAIPEIIEGKDRRKAGKTAPPHGLYLVEVYYS